MIKLFWSLFFPSGFTRFLNFQPKTNRALPAFFFWITVATPWLQFREFRDLESQRAWVYFETYNENLTFSYSFLSDLCVFGFNSQSKRGRELGSHPEWSEMDDSNFAQISETCFNQHSSWMYAGSESCHYQEPSSTGSTVIPRWDLPSLQLYNRVFTGLIGHPVSQRDNKADLLALKMPSVQFCAFKTQVRLFFFGVSCWIEAQKQQEWCFALLETQYCRMIENFLVFRQLLIDKKKHSRKEGIHIIVFKEQSRYRGFSMVYFIPE